MGRTLTHGEARDVYDRIGSFQDLERVIEVPAFRALAQGGRFRTSRTVLEFGPGTGALAELLLRGYLPAGATYVGLDVSPVMVRLARERLAPWRDRATVRLTDGSVTLDVPGGSVDRFVATFVLDLLSPADTRTLLAEAQRVLEPSGLLCLASATHGRTPLARLVTWGWERLHDLDPRIVGGCRPVEPGGFLAPDAWEVGLDRIHTSFGVSTKVLVAARRAAP